MEHFNERMARFFGGLPGFEIVFDRPTPLRVWLLSGTAIVGTMQGTVR